MNYRKKRYLINYISLFLSFLAALLGLFWLVFILFNVLYNGFSYLAPNIFTEEYAPILMGGGGLKHALIGQLIITIIAVLIGVPIGILGGTYIAEYGRNNKIANFTSTISDIMISVPSIVIGTFVYALLVRPFGSFNGLSGGIALAIIMIPVVLRTTEDMMRLVPWQLREAAFALGAPYYKVIMNVVYKSAITGIFTGILLAIARVAGETAPLLFTSFNNAYTTYKLTEPMPSLTVTIYQYATSPYESWHKIAWAGSLIITLFILLITIIGRFIIKWRYK
ncbi:MAG: phosphate ABC transporter permease PstA [Deferribacterota bacterium]|nr:phosphate ABC transporter permease PstA [Deferribacterota bacterium]